MERLKGLSEVCQPDPRNLAFVIEDHLAPKGVRKTVLTDLYAEATRLEFPETIPEPVRSGYVVARNLWLYGWFCWPFYKLASFEAWRCIEMALRLRCQQEGVYGETGKPPHTVGLKWLFEQALERGWLRDRGFENFRRIEARRREYERVMREGGFADRLPPEPSATEYAQLLAETLPKLRNAHAHPDSFSVGLPGRSLLHLELARDLIVQLL